MREKQMTWEEVQKLSAQNAQLVGHTNIKQKIKLHHRVKEENVTLKQEKAALTAALQKKELEIKKLRKQLEIVMPSASSSNNENDTSRLSLASTVDHSRPSLSAPRLSVAPCNKKRVALSVTSLNRTLL